MNSWEEFLRILRQKTASSICTFARKKQSKWPFWVKRYHLVKGWFYFFISSTYSSLLLFLVEECLYSCVFFFFFEKGTIWLIKPGCCTLTMQPVTMATAVLWHTAYLVLRSGACCYGNLEHHYFFPPKKALHKIIYHQLKWVQQLKIETWFNIL